MAASRFLRWFSGLLALMLLPLWGISAAAAPSPQTQVDFSQSQYVHIILGETNQETGIRLLTDQPDGLTQAVTESIGRQALPNPVSAERFFPFEVTDSYIFGGRNRVTLTVQYQDEGTGPIFLEYDALDPARPQSRLPEVVRKRAELVIRGDTGGLMSATVNLEDARFANSQPGGGDFRIGSAGDLTLVSVSLWLEQRDPAPPIRIYLDGREIPFDPDEVGPYVPEGSGQTLVPFRAIFDALGAKDVQWLPESRTVVAKTGKTTIRLTVDQPVAWVGSLSQQLDQPPIIVAGRVMVPLRFVAEQFGLRVETPKWDSQTRLILLTSGKR